MFGWRHWLERIAEVRECRRLHKRVSRALRVRPRGGCGDDRLTVRRTSTHLRIEWSARDVHPWDRDLPADRRAALFYEQCRMDTVAAVQRIFETLAEVDVIDIRVVEPNRLDRTILAGTVSRDDMKTTTRYRSPRMRLKLMGIDEESAYSEVG